MSFNQMKRREAQSRMAAVRKARRSPKAAEALQRVPQRRCLRTGVEMHVERRKWQRSAPMPVENRGRTGKDFANLWKGKRITKKAHAGRGQETKWEIPINP